MNGANTAAAPTLSKERIAEILAATDRTDADRANDARRKPAEMLDFIGIRPGMVALDLGAGGGYSTDVVARAVGLSGKVYGQYAAFTRAPAAPEGGAAPPAPPPPPAGATALPRPAPGAALIERAKKPATANIVPLLLKFDDPFPADIASGALDLVTIMYSYHDLGFMGVDRARMNQSVFVALKPGGMYVIADHAGRPGTGITESGTLHRVEQAFLVQEVEAAGFKLVAEGNFLRNPNDPRDKNAPVPAQPKDEFVVKFVKP